ncbi:MAG: hypothetical protein AB7O26_11715 [Planctomycetaceae bacterium]
MMRFPVKAGIAFAVIFASTSAATFAQFGEGGGPPVGTFLNPFPSAAVGALATRNKGPKAPVVSHRHLKYPVQPVAPAYAPPPSAPYATGSFVNQPFAAAPAVSAPPVSAPYPATPYLSGPGGGPCGNDACGPGGECGPIGACGPGYGGYDPLLHRCADSCRDNRRAWRHCWVKTCYHPIPAYAVPNYGYHPTAWGQIDNGGAPSNLPISPKAKAKTTPPPAPAEAAPEQKETPPTDSQPEQAPQTSPPTEIRPAEPPAAPPTPPKPPEPQAVDELPEVEAGLAPLRSPGTGNVKSMSPSNRLPAPSQGPELQPEEDSENFLPPLPVKTPLTSDRRVRGGESTTTETEEDAFPSVKSEESEPEGESKETIPAKKAQQPEVEQAPAETSPKAAPTPDELTTNAGSGRADQTSAKERVRNGRGKPSAEFNEKTAGTASRRNSKKGDPTARVEQTAGSEASDRAVR